MNDLAPYNPAPPARQSQSLTYIEALARHAIESKMYGWNNAASLIIMMSLCEAKGLHAIEALERYHPINGRPSMKADTMLAEFQSKGGVVRWIEYTDEAVTGEFVHAQSPEPLAVRWTLEMARNAGLLNKPGPWKQFPRAMLRSRVISEGIRTVLPGVCIGIYTPDETSAMPPIDIDETPVQGAPLRVTATPDPAPAHIEAPARKSNPARDRFDEVAAENGIIFATPKERGEFANTCLDRAKDSNKPIDWEEATQHLLRLVTVQAQDVEPGDDILPGEFEDPFGGDETTPAPESGLFGKDLPPVTQVAIKTPMEGGL